MQVSLFWPVLCNNHFFNGDRLAFCKGAHLRCLSFLNTELQGTFFQVYIQCKMPQPIISFETAGIPICSISVLALVRLSILPNPWKYPEHQTGKKEAHSRDSWDSKHSQQLKIWDPWGIWCTSDQRSTNAAFTSQFHLICHSLVSGQSLWTNTRLLSITDVSSEIFTPLF